MIEDIRMKKAIKAVAMYTLAASGTGAVPVPASSAAIVAENGAMIAQIAGIMGIPINIGVVVKSMGLAGTLNMVGRTLFIEGAKLLSWGTGSVWALVGLMALGATTAGLQTYIVGRLTIEIANNHGAVLPGRRASVVIADAKNNYDRFIADVKGAL